MLELSFEFTENPQFLVILTIHFLLGQIHKHKNSVMIMDQKDQYQNLCLNLLSKLNHINLVQKESHPIFDKISTLIHSIKNEKLDLFRSSDDLISTDTLVQVNQNLLKINERDAITWNEDLFKFHYLGTSPSRLNLFDKMPPKPLESKDTRIMP